MNLPFRSFKGLNFLLTDTQVPRDTKTLVAGVARRKLEVFSYFLLASGLYLTLTVSSLCPGT
jgi:mevalonate kinase